MALAGKVAGCLELKMVPPQNLCDSLARPRNGWHSVFHTVTRAACPPRSPGAKKAPAGACATNLSGQVDPRALTRKVAGCQRLCASPCLLVGFLRLPFTIWQSLELVVIVVFV